MIKYDVEYENFNDEKVKETLHFNITKAELIDNLDLAESFSEINKLTGLDSDRNLRPDEVKIIIDLVRRVIEIAYGVRSEGGNRFQKSDEDNSEIWDSFRWSGAHDAFLFSLFEDPERALNFLNNVFPSDLMADAREELKTKDVDLETLSFVPKTHPYILEGREPTDKELREMSKEEIVEAMKFKASKGL